MNSNYLYIGDFGDDAVRVVNLTASTCSYTLSANSAGFAAAAGDGSVNIATPNGCSWIATSHAPWLTLTAATQGTASGPIAFHVEANDTISSRTGTLTIGGQTLTVTQSGSACSYTLSANSVGFAATAGDGSVNIATLNGCGWTATSNAPWLTLTAATQGSASGPVAFHVEANDTFSSRTGHLHHWWPDTNSHPSARFRPALRRFAFCPGDALPRGYTRVRRGPIAQWADHARFRNSAKCLWHSGQRPGILS